MILLAQICLFGDFPAFILSLACVLHIIVEVVNHIVFAYPGSDCIFLCLGLDERVIPDSLIIVNFGIMLGYFLDSALETAVLRPLPLFLFELLYASGFWLAFVDLLLQLKIFLT